MYARERLIIALRASLRETHRRAGIPFGVSDEEGVADIAEAIDDLIAEKIDDLGLAAGVPHGMQRS